MKKIDIFSLEKVNDFSIKGPEIAVFERAYAYPNIVFELSEQNIKFRSPGAAALSLCDARNYSFVLFAGKIREFDIAAALHINDDLFIYQDDEFLIVTKSEQKLVQIKGIIKNNRL